ncbi:hypothetical protein V1477_007151 [Vespula maculifrons]|uniref:Uncharacterized protein n=1 Tax=Vespula maculifrons TaxID=7453 RepID=A0ABD2CHQ6_VESMC
MSNPMDILCVYKKCTIVTSVATTANTNANTITPHPPTVLQNLCEWSVGRTNFLKENSKKNKKKEAEQEEEEEEEGEKSKKGEKERRVGGAVERGKKCERNVVKPTRRGQKWRNEAILRKTGSKSIFLRNMKPFIALDKDDDTPGSHTLCTDFEKILEHSFNVKTMYKDLILNIKCNIRVSHTTSIFYHNIGNTVLFLFSSVQFSSVQFSLARFSSAQLSSAQLDSAQFNSTHPIPPLSPSLPLTTIEKASQ